MDERNIKILLQPFGLIFGLAIVVFLSMYTVKIFGILHISPILPILPNEIMVLVGIILILIWFSFFFLGTSYVGHGFISHSNHRLVTDGIYKYVRNPLVSAIVSCIFGLGLLLDQTGLIFASVIWGLIANAQCNKEEQELEQKFKSKYQNYKNTTPKYIPRIDILLSDVSKKVRG
jgi:protein-S-isoprenylcysteine O-methyltransferase Ste14